MSVRVSDPLAPGAVPVNGLYPNGSVYHRINDFSFAAGLGRRLNYTLVYLSRLTANDQGVNGNSIIAGLPSAGYLSIVSDTLDTIYVMRPGLSVVIFDEQSDGSFLSRYGVQKAFAHDSSASRYIMRYPDGTAVKYYDTTGAAALAGQLDRIIEPGGGETVATYDGSNKLTKIERIEGTTSQDGCGLVFSYDANGRIESVVYEVTKANQITDERRLSYSYYGSGSANGSSGDLRTVGLDVADDDSSSGGASDGWRQTRRRYMRYYKSTSGGGMAHGLKFALSPEAYRRLMEGSDASGPLTNPDDATDNEVAAHASKYIEGYDSEKRVTEITLKTI